jgi:hypothetical protein
MVAEDGRAPGGVTNGRNRGHGLRLAQRQVATWFGSGASPQSQVIPEERLDHGQDTW